MENKKKIRQIGNKAAPVKGGGRARLVQALLFIVIFFALLSGAFYGLSSPLFNLLEITFRGHETLTREDLEKAFPYPTGINIWKVDLARVEKQYSSLPRVARVTVERQPPGSLVITLEEKKAVALIPYQGYYFEVAADGTLVGTISRLPPGGLPMLTELEGVTYRPGENIASAEGGSLVISFLPEMVEMAGNISEISAANPNNLVIITLSGLKVWLGRGDYPAKLSFLPDILAALPQKGGYLDFRVLEAPTFVGK